MYRNYSCIDGRSEGWVTNHDNFNGMEVSGYVHVAKEPFWSGGFHWRDRFMTWFRQIDSWMLPMQASQVSQLNVFRSKTDKESLVTSISTKIKMLETRLALISALQTTWRRLVIDFLRLHSWHQLLPIVVQITRWKHQESWVVLSNFVLDCTRNELTVHFITSVTLSLNKFKARR